MKRNQNCLKILKGFSSRHIDIGCWFLCCQIDKAIYNQTPEGGIAETSATIHVFTQEDMIVAPEIKECRFAAAQEAGTVKKVQGILPGTAEGT